jgi:hypothetical protein
MNVDELTETMHATNLPTPLDLERVTRDGRRIRARRRAAVAGGLAVAVAAVAVPLGTWQRSASPEDAPFAGTSQRQDETARHEAVEREFLAQAPVGRPIGTVLQPGAAYAPKFYLGHRGGSSVGALALWGEQDGLAFGAHLIDGDGSLRRAGSLDVADLSPRGAQLSRVPFQAAQEPTFVGLLEVPRGTRPRDLTVRVRGEDTTVRTGVRLGVVPGRALVWVTATAGSAPGIDLSRFTIRDAGGHVLSSGGFEPWRAGAWEPMR